MYLCSGQALSARSMPGRPQPKGNKEAAADVWPCRVNGSGGGGLSVVVVAFLLMMLRRNAGKEPALALSNKREGHSYVEYVCNS